MSHKNEDEDENENEDDEEFSNFTYRIQNIRILQQNE